MRIAFQTGYRNTLADIERTNAELAKYQQQISSGKRLSVPSDDPTAAVGAVKEHTEIATLDQFTQSADSANSRLTVIDTVLSDVISKLTQAQATTASAMGNTATAQQRVSAADDLAGIRDSLFASFNTMFRGTYLFGGTDTTNAPYVQNPDGSIGPYLGDTTTQSVDINRQKAVQVTYNADAITRGADAIDVFGVLQNLIADVQSGNQANMQAGMDALKRAFNRAISTQSKVGTDENAVADEQSRLDSMRRAAAARLSTEEDTNMAAAITGLSAADTAHKAALGAAATINKLTLLDYL
jgi:flagellar hook-associated protein 3 FlgL